MEETTNNINIEPVQKRPPMLQVLCILTFIWSGFNMIYNLIYGLFYNALKEFIVNMEFPKNYKELKDVILYVFSGGRFFFLSGFLLCFFSIFGAYKMWKLQKNGFHFYTVAQLLMLMLPMIFIHGEKLNVVEVLITALFILYYARFLKLMA
ncbi:MAG: hypothetical protein NTZ33_16160 [Bacteroidetes bacterium]|nr:hypothetical protein [Bacteroidota bacterium]